MNPSYDFKGQVALVTGASSGIGLATAQLFAAAGAAVVLVDINENALHSATAALTRASYQALSVLCDVADEAQAAAMVERTVATFGRLDRMCQNWEHTISLRWSKALQPGLGRGYGCR
jgi:NAD(P)-dependent dehydrogenase (short-subunit alcohol dehydrogenase family)